jgi:imidazolonepropionase-like amidohydrolase
VREAARAGMDQIKTASSGHYRMFGPLGNSGGLKRSQTIEEFKALVDEAHANGMMVMRHSHGSEEGILHAIEAGVDTIEHAIPLTDEVIKQLVKKDIIIVPTLSIMMRPARIAMGMDTYRRARTGLSKSAGGGI